MYAYVSCVATCTCRSTRGLNILLKSLKFLFFHSEFLSFIEFNIQQEQQPNTTRYNNTIQPLST